MADLIAVVSFERFDQLLLHRNSLRESALFKVCRRSHALTVEGNIDLFDVTIELILHALANALEALRHLIYIIYTTFANEVGR